MAKAKKKSASKKYYVHDDHNFIMIAGGGFLVLLLIFMTNGMILGYRHTRTEASTHKIVERKVVIENFKLVPETLNVTRGTTVTWMNKDNATHTLTSDDGSFNTGKIGQDESGSITFENVGTFSYHEQLNPQLRGMIVVQ